MRNKLFIFVIIFIYTFSLYNLDGELKNNSNDPPDLIHFEKFMTVDGKKFAGDFKFMGANLDPWRFITQAGEVYSYDEIREWVKNAVNCTNAKVIRMHINGGAFEPTVGNYNEDSFKQLDCLVAACVEYRVYVLISLRDYLWSPWPPQAYDPYWYLSGGTKANPNKNAILTNNSAKDAFKNFISYLLNRTNTITKVAYKDETNILGWEIINEPNIIKDTTGNWLACMAKYIKSIDPDHIVGVATVGVEGEWWDEGVNPSPWDEINLRELDFIDIHYYADAALYNPVSKMNVLKIKNRVKKVLSFNKPCIIGEFGCINTKSLKAILNLYNTVITNAFNEGASGVMPYSWGPLGPNRYGDQGSYCIYIDDVEICNLLKSLAP